MDSVALYFAILAFTVGMSGIMQGNIETNKP